MRLYNDKTFYGDFWSLLAPKTLSWNMMLMTPSHHKSNVRNFRRLWMTSIKTPIWTEIKKEFRKNFVSISLNANFRLKSLNSKCLLYHNSVKSMPSENILWLKLGFTPKWHLEIKIYWYFAENDFRGCKVSNKYCFILH